MKNRAQLHIEHYRGNEDFVKRVYDLIDRSVTRQRILVTPFFSPDQLDITKTICGKQCAYEVSGGYEGAERCRVAFLPFTATPSFSIVMLKAEITKVEPLSHRDVLGAIMHLGLQRDKIGDILVKEEAIYLFVEEEIVNYIICNLLRIKRMHVSFERSEDDVVPTSTIQYSQAIVSSLRLDALIASLTHVSRAQAQAMITAGQVKVNHVVLEQTSFLCNNNSAISIRGYGRYHFKEVVKKTKKDHYVIDVGVYE